MRRSKEKVAKVADWRSVQNDEGNLNKNGERSSRSLTPERNRAETVTTPISSPKMKKGKKKAITPKSRSSPQKKGKLNYKKLQSKGFDDENEGIEETTRTRAVGSSTKKNVVQFEEDGNLIEMVTEGMDTDFLSDEGQEEVDSSEEGEVFDEVNLESSKNNNATVTSKMRKQSAEVLDEDRQKRQKLNEEEDELSKEERLVNKTVAKIQEIMAQGGYFSKQRGKNNGDLHCSNSPSTSTIYKEAIQPMNGLGKDKINENRKGTSSKEEDEFTTVRQLEKGGLVNDQELIENFITECRVSAVPATATTMEREEQPQPGTTSSTTSVSAGPKIGDGKSTMQTSGEADVS